MHPAACNHNILRSYNNLLQYCVFCCQNRSNWGRAAFFPFPRVDVFIMHAARHYFASTVAHSCSFHKFYGGHWQSETYRSNFGRQMHGTRYSRIWREDAEKWGLDMECGFLTPIVLVAFTRVDPFQGHSNTSPPPPPKRNPELYFFVSCCLSKFKLCMAILWSGLYFECCFVMGLHAERLIDWWLLLYSTILQLTLLTKRFLDII